MEIMCILGLKKLIVCFDQLKKIVNLFGVKIKMQAKFDVDGLPIFFLSKVFSSFWIVISCFYQCLSNQWEDFEYKLYLTQEEDHLYCQKLPAETGLQELTKMKDCS